MTKSGNPLTRKAGPLPLWAWALVIVGAYLAYTHFAGGAVTPTAAAAPSPVPFADSGSVTTPPSGSSDSGLPPSFAPLNPVAGGTGVAAGDASSAAASTSAAAAAPIAAGAPADASVAPSAPLTSPPVQGETTPTGSVYDAASGGWLIPTPGALARSGVMPAYTTPPDALVGNTPQGGQFAPPSPYVSPPVDTSVPIAPSYLTPAPSLGHAVMV